MQTEEDTARQGLPSQGSCSSCLALVMKQTSCEGNGSCAFSPCSFRRLPPAGLAAPAHPGKRSVPP
eukprot:5480711-Pyramimonas_sp.AAC.1